MGLNFFVRMYVHIRICKSPYACAIIHTLFTWKAKNYWMILCKVLSLLWN